MWFCVSVSVDRIMPRFSRIPERHVMLSSPYVMSYVFSRCRRPNAASGAGTLFFFNVELALDMLLAEAL